MQSQMSCKEDISMEKKDMTQNIGCSKPTKYKELTAIIHITGLAEMASDICICPKLK